MKKITLGLISLMFAMSAVCQNPFFEDWNANPHRIPPFSRIENEHYMPALQEAVRLQNATLERIAKDRSEATFENTIVPFDKSGEMIEKVAGVLFNISEAQSNDTLRNIVIEAMQLLSAQNDNVCMNPFLFRRVKRIKENNENLDKIQKKLVDDIYRTFVLNGAELDAARQEELKTVNLRLSELENTFTQNLLLATAEYELWVEDKNRLAGLPQDDLQRAAEKAAAKGKKGYLFGLDNPTVMPFLQYVRDAALRKEILDAYTNRCAPGTRYDNTPVVREIVALRLKKAQLLGFPDYASYALQTRMAQRPDAVYSLLNQVWTAGLTRAKEELEQMKKYRRTVEKNNGAFLPSDWRYYANLIKEKQYSLDENLVREYFPLDKVREGVFLVANRLYGIKFTALEDVEIPTPNTTAYLCVDADGTELGVLYLDMVARPGYKSGGAWNTNYVEQAYDENGKRLIPVTSIVCNYTPPVEGKPTLLNIDETQTFFHEFGHALHSLFAEVKYTGLAQVPRDFVELPSQIMEHWAMNPLVLAQYARHYKTGAPIPPQLVERIQQVLNYGQGFATTELIAAALLDMEYHTLRQADSNLDPAAFEAEMAKKLGLIPEILPRYRTNYFAHTMGGGYSAGYYSYTWAEVLDCDAFSMYLESGDIFNRRVAERFRQRILKNGGMYPAMEMYTDFRGHKPDVRALLKSRGLDK